MRLTYKNTVTSPTRPMVEAYADGKYAGCVKVIADVEDHVAWIGYTSIYPELRRQGIATKANAFWEKQRAKKRAKLKYTEAGGYPQYRLRCPAPRTLAGLGALSIQTMWITPSGGTVPVGGSTHGEVAALWLKDAGDEVILDAYERDIGIAEAIGARRAGEMGWIRVVGEDNDYFGLEMDKPPTAAQWRVISGMLATRNKQRLPLTVEANDTRRYRRAFERDAFDVVALDELHDFVHSVYGAEES